MRPILSECPSCQGKLSITRLECPSCAIKFDGEFSFPPLLRLSASQLDFIEVFVKNRGVIREVERELGVSYPTVRARLDDVVAALGAQLRGDSDHRRTFEDAGAHRRRVLADLKAGRITPEEALAEIGGRRDSRD